MPSPIAHVAAGYAVGRVWSARSDSVVRGAPWAAVGLSLLPDMDAAVGLLLGDMGRYHNHMMASPVSAVVVAFVVGMVARQLRADFWNWFTLTLVCYLLHLTMDFFTVGRGIMLLWPLSEERFRPPVAFFIGLHWSDGWMSIRHLWTALSELATIAAVWLLLAAGARVRAASH